MTPTAPETAQTLDPIALYGLTQEQIDAIDAVLTATTLHGYKRKALAYIVAERITHEDMEEYAAKQNPPMYVFKNTNDITQFASDNLNLVDGDEYERLETRVGELEDQLQDANGDGGFTAAEYYGWADRARSEIQAGRKDYAIQMLEAFALEGKMI